MFQCVHILKPSSYRSLYIFYASSENKNRSYKIFAFIKALPRFGKSFHLKMTFTSCTDENRVKVPSFQKVTLFLQYKIFNRDGIRLHFCLFEDVNDFRNSKRSGSKKFCLNRIFRYFYAII